MATKAEQFRYEQERSGVKRSKKPVKVHHLDPAHTMTRNVTLRGDKYPSAALEDSMSGKPSRKSTRGSSHHGRTDTKLQRAAQQRASSPKAIATRAKSARH